MEEKEIVVRESILFALAEEAGKFEMVKTLLRQGCPREIILDALDEEEACECEEAEVKEISFGEFLRQLADAFDGNE